MSCAELCITLLLNTKIDNKICNNITVEQYIIYICPCGPATSKLSVITSSDEQSDNLYDPMDLCLSNNSRKDPMWKFLHM